MVLVAVVALVVIGEIVARQQVASRVSQRLRDAGVSGAITTQVGDSWWRPTVLRALATGSVDRVRVEVVDGDVGGLPVRRLTYTLHDVSGRFRPTGDDASVDSIGSLDVDLRLDPTVVAAAAAAGRPIVDAYWVPCVATRVAGTEGDVDGVVLGCTARGAVPGFLRARPGDVGGPTAPGAEVLPEPPTSGG